MKIATLGLLVASIAVGFGSGDAYAGMTVSGDVCHGLNGGGGDPYFWGMESSNFFNTTINVRCAIPMDHQLGSTVTFRVRMSDNNGTNNENISCTGEIRTQDGGTVASSGTMVSGTGTFTGGATKTSTATVPNPPGQSATYMYAVTCAIPGTVGPSMSSVITIRAS